MNCTTVWGRRVAAVTLVFTVLGIGGSMSFGDTPPPTPDSDVLGHLRSAETTGSDALLVGAPVQIGTEHPAEISLPVSVFALRSDRPVTVRSIRVAGPDGKTRASTRPNKTLTPVTDVARTGEDALALLADRDRHRARAFLARGIPQPRVSVPVGDLSLEDGVTTTFTVTASLDVAGEPTTLVMPLAATVAMIPSATYWGSGDGHVHSSTWSDGWDTLSWQVGDAKVAGHKWIVMTDHWRGIWAKSGRGNANWGLYQNDCSAMQVRYGIPVLPGVEIMSAGNQGHSLGYALSATKVPPRDDYLAPAQVIDALGAHTPGTSFSVVAHPYSVMADVWGDWRAKGFRAIELMSQERQATPATEQRWFALLRAGMAAKIAAGSGGAFVVGVANTDSHLTWQRPGQAGVTWIRSTVSPLTRDAVYGAIRSGAVSASGREDLGYFTLNGVQQGGVAIASSTTSLKFSITQKPVTGRKCTEVSIRDSNGAVVWSVSNPTTTTLAKTLPAPPADTFYVVKMVFAKTGDTDYSHVWCNPVFVDRR